MAESNLTTTSNGYGTLAQAGWTEQAPLGSTTHGGSVGLAMASITYSAVLLSVPAAGGHVTMTLGCYVAPAHVIVLVGFSWRLC